MDVLSWILIGVVAVAVLLAVGVLLRRARQRRLDERRTRAEALRADAAVDAGGVVRAREEADRAAAEAARVRQQAEAAERQARDAQQRAAQEEARQEDRVREADRLDPEVDHRADDYRPEPPPAGPAPGEVGGPTEAGSLPPDEPGAHRA